MSLFYLNFILRPASKVWWKIKVVLLRGSCLESEKKKRCVGMTAYNYDAGPGSGQQFLVLGSLPSPWSGARGTGDWPGPDKLPARPRLCVAIKSRFYKNSWTWKRRLTARPSSLQTGFHIFIVWYGLFGVEEGIKTRIKVLCAPVFIVPETLKHFQAHYHSKSCLVLRYDWYFSCLFGVHEP